MADLLPIALRFLAQGISVLPAANDGSKRPAIEWKKYQSQLPTSNEVISWFKQGNDGLGVVTGLVSGNLEMLELEGRAVVSKMHLDIAEIATNSGIGAIWEKLNAGYVELTPSGGIHWLYKVSDGQLPGNTKLARKPGENGGVDVLAETRSEGGWTITAPSGGGTHPSGGSWQLIGGSIENIPTITMAERESLHAIFTLFDEMPKVEGIAAEVAPRPEGILSPGDDYNARTTWDEILTPLDWKPIYKKGEATIWRRQGKNDGISATTNFNGNDKLFVFSTSTIFEAESSLSKFAAYATISHNGDFKRAAQDLRTQGYGAQTLNSFDSNISLKPKNAIEMPSQATQAPQGEEESSWRPIDLADYYDGLFVAPTPTILKRSDGHGLIYKGRVHSIYGESESGKSWVAQIATAECLRADQKVIYIDFESDAIDIVNRLKALGVSRANLLQYFSYIRPDGPRDVNDPYWQNILLPDSATLVVIDGVTESLTMWGGETKDNDTITRWMRIFPRTVASASGAAVVLIDHITKNADTRGRFAIGGQAKLATIDGAAYLVEPIQPLSPGKVGVLTMRVTKDRPGFIRKVAGMWRKSDRTQEAAILTIDSTRAAMAYVIGVPKDEDQLEAEHAQAKTVEFMEYVHANGGANMRTLYDGLKGRKELVKERLLELIDLGFVENRGNDKSFILYVTNAGKAEFNLHDAVITQIGVS